MKTRDKIALDRLLGLPIAWTLNFAARLLGKILRRNHSCEPENVRTIVFAKYLGMGSIIQATPLIRTVHASYPNAQIIFVTGAACRNLITRLEYVDRIITVDDRSLGSIVVTSIRAISVLMRAKVDLFF